MAISQPYVIEKQNIQYLNEILLDKNGEIKILPSVELNKIPHNHLMQWAVEKAVYHFPTEELISWLKDMIGSKKAIEIGSGHVALGRYLGVRCTDNYSQTKPEMQIYYRLCGQTPISPSREHVEELEALDAVEKYKPEVVFGAYITQKYKSGDEKNKVGSNIYGPDEEALVQQVGTYIHIGNEVIHGDKRILSMPHQKFSFPWLFCRASQPNKNVIYVWNKHDN